MSDKKMIVISLILNIAIVFSTIFAVGNYFTSSPDILGSSRGGCFKYFTTDSNVLCAVTALILCFFEVKQLFTSQMVIPKWAVILKFTGVVSFTVTLLTVIFFLAPVSCMKGGWSNFLFYFKGNVFALHLSTPVLAIISFVFFEKTVHLGSKDLLWALIPTILYSFVYLYMVVFAHKWNDWYGFTFGGKLFLAPVSMAGMYLATWGIAWILMKLRRC